MSKSDTVGIIEVSDALKATLGNADNFRVQFHNLVRQAIDEVIDTPRTGRTKLSEIEKTEKTYIGTKIEILARALLKLPRGTKLDLLVENHEVDVKFTVTGNWMVPMTTLNELCLLIFADTKKQTFGVGLLRMTKNNISESENRDKKRRVNSTGKNNILWLAYSQLHDRPIEADGNTGIYHI